MKGGILHILIIGLRFYSQYRNTYTYMFVFILERERNCPPRGRTSNSLIELFPVAKPFSLLLALDTNKSSRACGARGACLGR